MRTVHAWVLEDPEGRTSFKASAEIPAGTELLGTRLSTSGLQVFGIADLDAEPETRRFLAIGHGHRDRVGDPLPDEVGGVHRIGTADHVGGPTFHVFETTSVTAAA